MKNLYVYPLKEPLANDQLGITLRDYFAGLAMQSLQEWVCIKEMSKRAYEIADAMLEEHLK
jgi:hypothetical protein